MTHLALISIPFENENFLFRECDMALFFITISYICFQQNIGAFSMKFNSGLWGMKL